MKNTIPAAIISLLILGLLGCVTTKSTEENTGGNAEESIGENSERNVEKSIRDRETQSRYYLVEAENMGIKVVGPQRPMVAPSNNEQAMQAYTIGSRFLDENNLTEAERYLTEAIKLDPLFVDAMDHLGMVYRRQNRLDEAEEMYLRSISINDKNAVPYQNLAIVYKRG
ncbi:MAG: tetratricopeptide repeat protein [Treponema sp.]|nr:tetratricopeptide repeat protein [Treponema sp.]